MVSTSRKAGLLSLSVLGSLIQGTASENAPSQAKELSLTDASNFQPLENLWEQAAAQLDIDADAERLLQEFHGDRLVEFSMSMPTEKPTPRPTGINPTQSPSFSPTIPVAPTRSPAPTKAPTRVPTEAPTGTPNPTMVTTAPTPSPTGMATPVPTAATPAPTRTPAPSLFPTELCFDSTKEDFLIQILSPITDPDILLDPTTPQGMAFDYLLNEDPFLTNPCGATTIPQRYGLTTLFFSTNGQSWTESDGWLGAEQECNWFGVTCAGGELVTKLELRKFNRP